MPREIHYSKLLTSLYEIFKKYIVAYFQKTGDFKCCMNGFFLLVYFVKVLTIIYKILYLSI